MIAGAKRARKNLEDQADNNPLILGNMNMQRVKEAKYLGIWLAGSVAESVAATVSHRLGLASRSIFEIKAVIEDSRADSLGAVEVGLTLWEQSVIPFLLFGSETWNEIPIKTMKQLVDLNKRFLKTLLGVGKHRCPTPSLYLETASWTIQNQILLKKVFFYHHLATLPSHSLGSECYQAQKKGLPGIVTECLEIFKEWNITGVEAYSKWSWKRLMKSKLALKNAGDLFQWSQGYKKINIKCYERNNLKTKDYLKNLNLEKARVIFRKNCGMIKTVRSNFKNVKKYKAEKYLCPDCRHLEPPVSHVDKQDLLTHCEGNRDLREGLELSDLSQLAEYFRRVIERRTQRYGG